MKTSLFSTCFRKVKQRDVVTDRNVRLVRSSLYSPKHITTGVKFVVPPQHKIVRRVSPFRRDGVLLVKLLSTKKKLSREYTIAFSHRKTHGNYPPPPPSHLEGSRITCLAFSSTSAACCAAREACSLPNAAASALSLLTSLLMPFSTLASLLPVVS